jgi:hypothetical protein
MQRDVHERGWPQRHMWQPTIPLSEMRERWLQARELRDCDQWEGLLHERNLGPFPALLQVWIQRELGGPGVGKSRTARIAEGHLAF